MNILKNGGSTARMEKIDINREIYIEINVRLAGVDAVKKRMMAVSCVGII